MKSFFIALVTMSSSLVIAQQPTHSVSQTQYFQQKETAIQEALAAKPHLRMPDQKQPSDVMIISPEMRAKDFAKAFDYLKTKAPATKIGIKLLDKSTISDIVKIDVMPGGTLMIFTVSTVKGLKYQVVKTEHVDSIVHT